MTVEEQLLDVLQRMKFLQADAQRIHDTIVEQGFRTEEQSTEMEMMHTIADEITAEVDCITLKAEAAYTCRHCGKPAKHIAGKWMHVNSTDFAKCGKAGIPREAGEAS